MTGFSRPGHILHKNKAKITKLTSRITIYAVPIRIIMEIELPASKTCEGFLFHKNIPFTRSEYQQDLMVEEIVWKLSL